MIGQSYSNHCQESKSGLRFFQSDDGWGQKYREKTKEKKEIYYKEMVVILKQNLNNRFFYLYELFTLLIKY